MVYNPAPVTGVNDILTVPASVADSDTNKLVGGVDTKLRLARRIRSGMDNLRENDVAVDVDKDVNSPAEGSVKYFPSAFSI